MKEYIYIPYSHIYIYIYIYSALLQRIEHCSTRKSTGRLPIYLYIYIYIYILQSEPLEHRFQNIEDISSSLKQIHTLFDY